MGSPLVHCSHGITQSQFGETSSRPRGRTHGGESKRRAREPVPGIPRPHGEHLAIEE
jgi:hypothetical protein